MLFSKLSPVALQLKKSKFPSQCCLAEEEKVSCFRKKGGWRLERASNFSFSIAFLFLIAKHEEETSSQAPSYASLKLWLTDSLTGVKCRATRVAKNWESLKKSPVLRKRVDGVPFPLFIAFLKSPAEDSKKCCTGRERAKQKKQNLSY